jgi:cytochrome b
MGWLDWHFYAGYGIATLLMFRLAWGLVGPRYARFGSFVAGPVRVGATCATGLAAAHEPPATRHPAAG